MNIKNRRNNKGFTLVELLLVLLIIVIIGIILIPNVLESLNESRIENGKSIEKLLIKNLELYNKDNEKDLWASSNDSYGCVNIKYSELLSANPDIKLGECLLNNDIDSLTIEKVDVNKYKYYAGVTCGKKLLPDPSNKYIISDNEESKDIYYKSESYNCDRPFTVTADPNRGIITDGNGWTIVDNKAKKELQPGALYESLPTLYNSEGYECSGWNTDKDGNGEDIYENSTATLDVQTIYAKCRNTSQIGDLTFDNQEIEIDYKPSPQTVNIPKIPNNGTGTFTYTEVSETDNNGNQTDYISISGSTLVITGATPIGTYTYKIRATDSVTGNTADADYTITVKKVTLSIPNSPSDKTYNGASQRSGITCPTGSSAEGTQTAINAGTYTQICRISEPEKYKWSDGTTTEKSIQWKINKETCQAPQNLKVSTGGIVTWTSANGATGYKISMDESNWSDGTSGMNYLNTIIEEPGNRTIHVRTVCDSTNYGETSSTSSQSIAVHKISFESNDQNKGTVSPKSYNVIEGSTYEKSGNNILIKGVMTGSAVSTLKTVTPTAKPGHTFDNWDKTSGELTSSQTITASFKAESYTVNITVLNGLVDRSSTTAEYNTSPTFTITPTIEGASAKVSCTKDQNASVSGNTLTVNNVSDNTTCTVTFSTDQTTLYEDGTLIINEKVAARSSNVTRHGEVTKEYDTISPSNVYIFDVPSSQLWYSERLSVKKVELGETIKPTNTSYWFYDLRNMTSGNFENLDTSAVINMNSMFYQAGSNSEINSFVLSGLNSWDISKVTNMNSMFNQAGANAENWSIGNLSGWYKDDTTWAVTNMEEMFYQAGKNANSFELDLSNWDVSNVTTMKGMFQEAGYISHNWSIGNLSNWNTSKVTTMNSMFYQAGNNATTWDIGTLNNWDVSKVTATNSMFANAGQKATTWNIGDLSNWFKTETNPQVNNMVSMFQEAGVNANSWSIGDLSNWDTSKVTAMSSMFMKAGYKSNEFNIGNLNNWDVSKVTGMLSMFQEAGYSATSWNIGNLSNWNTSNVKFISGMFNRAGYKSNEFNIGNLNNWNVSKATNMKDMFNQAGYSATSWNIGNLNNWNVSKVTNMQDMFNQAGYSATTWNIGNLSNWDTSKVTTVHGMFDQAGHESNSFVLDLSNWFKTETNPQVNTMSSMFSNAGQNATTWSIGNISNWDVSKVKTMNSMFNGIGHRATSINMDLSSWDTSSVTDMGSMFQEAGNSSITFNIGSLKVYAKSINQMFQNTSKINATLNIYSNPENYNNTFNGAATYTGSLITVNYSASTTNIDNIISTKSFSSNVEKTSSPTLIN